MPSSIRQIVEEFVAEHHVEQPFYKRERSKSGRSVRRGGGAKDAKRERLRKILIPLA